MRINVLGPVRVEGIERVRGAADVVTLAAKERSLLATLALRAGTTVSTEALIRSLWGDDPPASARKTLQTYVSNVRQAIGADAIATQDTGYLLTIDAEAVDVHRFRALVKVGEDALRKGDPTLARHKLREALALWRGEAFSDVAAHTALAGEGVRLHEERLSALEMRIAADLAAGAHEDLVVELDALVAEHPFRERLWGDLMVALYRCGRQADALATYQRARRRLVDELGLEPGGELRRIEEAILTQEPWLSAPVAAPATAVAAFGAASSVLRSPVRYVESTGGVSIAYQVAGDGPIDILAIPGFVTHLDIWWNAPTDGLVRRLTSVGRLISFDKRGMGLSDRPDVISPADWVDDALAVLDALGAKEVVVLGISAGTPTAIRLASQHAERVRALVVFGGGARTIVGPGYEIGHDRATLDGFAANLQRGWGSGVAISSYAPSLAREPHVREYWARYQQLSASPTAALRSFWTAVEDDVIDLLPTITAPTLVLHPERDVIAPVAWGRFVAERIAGAEFVALDSDIDLICVSDVIADMASEITGFVARKVPDAASDVPDVALVTVVAVHAPATAGLGTAIDVALGRFGGDVQARPVHTAVFDAPAKALRCVQLLLREVTASRASSAGVGVGVQVGECTRTPIGFRGDAVDVAHQLALRAQPEGEALLTGTVRQFLSSSVHDDFEPRSPHRDDPVFAIVSG